MRCYVLSTDFEAKSKGSDSKSAAPELPAPLFSDRLISLLVSTMCSTIGSVTMGWSFTSAAPPDRREAVSGMVRAMLRTVRIEVVLSMRAAAASANPTIDRIQPKQAEIITDEKELLSVRDALYLALSHFQKHLISRVGVDPRTSVRFRCISSSVH